MLNTHFMFKKNYLKIIYIFFSESHIKAATNIKKNLNHAVLVFNLRCTI